MASLAQTAFRMLDDWGLASRRDAHRRAVLALLADRHGRGATMVTSQLPVGHWHAALGNPTLADALLDRRLQNAYTIARRGESMRKRHTTIKHDGPAM
jgi:DNA replication protein DnaC